MKRHWAVGILVLVLASGTAWAHGSSYREPGYRYRGAARDPMPPGLSPGTASWERWWSLNKEEFLYPPPDSSRVLTGAASNEPAPEEDAIIPAMAAALDEGLSCPDRARIALALGSMGSSLGLPQEVLDRFSELSRDDGQQTIVQVTCALALGLSGDKGPRRVTALAEMVLDANLRSQTRGSAALALGLLRIQPGERCHELVVQALRRACLDPAQETLPACALLAMGISGDRAFLPDLLGLLRRGGAVEEGSHSDKVLSYAVSALGKLGEDHPDLANPELLTILKQILARSRPHTFPAALIASGQLGGHTGANPRIVAELAGLLVSALKSGAGKERELAMLSLGRIGAAATSPSLVSRIRAILEAELMTEKPEPRPHAALALALLGRRPDLPSDVRTSLRERITAGLKAPYPEPNTLPPGLAFAPTDPPPPPLTETPPPAPLRMAGPAGRGAHAISLGLLNDDEAIPALFEVLNESAHAGKLRGYAAVALAMLGQGTEQNIRRAFLVSKDGDLLVLSSIAAGLTGGEEVGGILLPILTSQGPSGFQKVLVVRALGKLGRKEAVAPLLRLLRNTDADGTLRSVAAIALADLFDKRGELPLTRLTRNLNDGSAVDTIRSILSVF